MIKKLPRFASKFFLLLIVFAATTGVVVYKNSEAVVCVPGVVNCSTGAKITSRACTDGPVTPDQQLQDQTWLRDLFIGTVYASCNAAPISGVYQVNNYVQVYVETTDGGGDIYSATLYVKPTCCATVEWTPVASNSNGPGLFAEVPGNLPVYDSDVQIYNAYSNAFPLITKTCATSPASRKYYFKAVLNDPLGVVQTNTITVQISATGVKNPPNC